MNYIEVAVFTKTKGNADVFTYHAPEETKTGQIVNIPFRDRELYGVVLSTKNKKPDFQTREVLEVLDSELSLPEHLIKTAFFTSNYYFCPLASVLKTMLPRGFYKKRRQVENNIFEIKNKDDLKYPTLTKEQSEALAKIKNSKSEKPFLLYGVTGSGKTEIYLRLIEKSLKEGKGAIVLVPEIALTPQTIGRFEERFPGKVTILNSSLKETEKQRNWNSLRSNEKSIVIGSRSAIFAPIKNLGTIIIDEEHDNSYKQDTNPRYDTRIIAEYISRESGAKLILGSATPSIESFQKAENNRYFLLQLNKRITQDDLPEVRIVDLRDEYKSNPNTVISFPLQEEIAKTLEKGRKVIIFLNRRGSATHVFCRDCGFTEKCPSCDIPLTHHFTENENALKCHHCGFLKKIPLKCPSCNSLAIRYYGLGIQRVESELKKQFPQAKILRMDKDTVKERDSYERIFKAFKNGEANILLGTQMISKGWDIPEVDLVGVISADNALNFPDFRANEKSFQLLTQISGRPGRRDSRGLVYIQTFNPENRILTYVKKHDFIGFYKEEIKTREAFGYPPFSRIIRLLVKDKDSNNTRKKASDLKVELEKWLLKNYNDDLVKILGPSPCFLQKIAGYYRWQLVLKVDNHAEEEKIKEIIKIAQENSIIDIDPNNLV